MTRVGIAAAIGVLGVAGVGAAFWIAPASDREPTVRRLAPPAATVAVRTPTPVPAVVPSREPAIPPPVATTPLPSPQVPRASATGSTPPIVPAVTRTERAPAERSP